jgi:hypothetical protein
MVEHLLISDAGLSQKQTATITASIGGFCQVSEKADHSDMKLTIRISILRARVDYGSHMVAGPKHSQLEPKTRRTTMKFTLTSIALGFTILTAAALSTTPSFARQGADDPAGHVRQGRGADDGAGHVRRCRGCDDLLNTDGRGRSGDDHGRGRGGDDNGKGGKGRGGNDDGPGHTFNLDGSQLPIMARRGADDPTGDDSGRGRKGGKGRGGHDDGPNHA